MKATARGAHSSLVVSYEDVGVCLIFFCLAGFKNVYFI